MNDETPVSSYQADSIEVLEGLQPVRQRPGMYIGGTDKRALHHIFFEVLDNSVDESMALDAKGAPYCTRIDVLLEADGETITVSDNGRGIPVTVHEKYKAEGKTALEIVLTILHAGGKFNDKSYTGGSGGLHGVGVSCTNAVSDSLIAHVWRDGGSFEQRFSRGEPITKTERIGDSRKRGTAITFHPDTEIFTDGIDFNEDVIVARLREIAMLNAGLRITFQSKKTSRSDDFCFAGGIADYVSYLNSARSGLYPPDVITVSGNYHHVQKDKTIHADIALQWARDDGEIIKLFANNITNPDGGTHLSGFKTALTRIVNGFARSTGLLKEKSPNLSGDDIRDGLTAVISVKLTQPQFESQTKVKLVSVEAESAVNTILGDGLTEFFEKNPQVIKMIAERAVTSQQAREAAKNAAEAIKRKGAFSKSYRLPGKLKDCQTEKRELAEIFIVEGDSAAGSAKSGRDSEYQAVLPIRGKIINAEKHDVLTMFKNAEVCDLIAAIGTGVDTGGDDDSSSSFNYDKLRYDKVIILSDADIDGAHIQCLLLAFIYRFMPELVKRGHIYVAQPPLYRVDVGKKSTYAWTEDEMTALTEKAAGKSKVIRFKGLGEMDFDELRETTMKKETRRLLQITIEDVAEVEQMLSVLMGDNITARKAHIVAKSQLRDLIALAAA